MFDLLIESFKDPTYVLTAGLLFKYKFTKNSKKIDYLHKELTRVFRKDYERRFNASQTPNSPTQGKGVLQRIVEHNQECMKNGLESEMMTSEDIVANMILFLFAGFDTTLNFVTNSLISLSEDKESQKMISNFAKKLLEGKDSKKMSQLSYEESPGFNNCF